MRQLSGVLAVVVVAVLVGAGGTQAKPRSGKIDFDKGIAGVNLGLQRGPAPKRRGHKAPTTVTSVIGKPSSVSELPRMGATAEERSIYLALYKDDGLGVYFSKRNARNKIDGKRDRYDRVVGVTTYSPRYTGPYAVGKALSEAGDAKCAPLDRRAGTGGRRVLACPVDKGDDGYGIVYLSGGTGSRASQRINQVAVFKPVEGLVIFQSLVQGALEDLDCETIACP